MSFSTIISFSIPPSGIIPILPFPKGIVSSHRCAGLSYHKRSGGLCAKIEEGKIIAPIPRKRQMLRHKLYRTENSAQINVFAGKHAQAPPLEWRLVSKQIETACFIRSRQMLRHKLYRTENSAQINVFAGKHAQAPPLEWRLVSKQIEAACFIRLR